MTLDEAVTRLETISFNPCACNVCKHAAKLAREALMQISPLGEQLLQTVERDSDEFRAIERQFRDEEFTRLSNALAYIARGRCMMLTPIKIEHTAPEIPALPYQEGLRESAERYRKYTAQQRAEYLKKPRVPGSYWIKPRQRDD